MQTMRYFMNKFTDFTPGARVQVDHDFWKGVIFNLCSKIQEKVHPSLEQCDGGLYTGAAGVAYMFYHLARSSVFKDQREMLLANAKQYIETAIKYCESSKCRDPPTSLLVGSAGVYAVAGMVYEETGSGEQAVDMVRRFTALGSMCRPRDYLGCGSDEYLLGRVGYLCGAHQMNRKLGQVVPGELAHGLCQVTVESGRDYARRHRSQAPLMYSYYQTEYLGAAHGLSSILQILLCFPDFIRADPSVEKDVRDSVDFMLSLMQPNGNIAPAMDEVKSHTRRPESEELVHWCHGAPGVVYLFAKAWLLWRDDRYLQACYRCGEITWQKGLLRKGPGICHGVAGSGYVFLLLYRLTADEKHLHRAFKFAEFMQTEEFKTKSRTPDCPYSLYEGLAGTVCFLTDLLQPQEAEFPLFDVL